MSIVSIPAQPAANSIQAAYRPVAITVRAKRTDDDPRPPVVYCDIYFNDIFYKTLAKSQYSVLNAENSDWEFDIQDATQEYLEKFIGTLGDSNIVEATPVVLKAQCKFRSSGYDADGFIQYEDVAPVQGTTDEDPVAGTGTATNTFYVVNATLQHEDNQDLSLHLFYHKKRTWTADAHPLSHRPDHYKLGPYDADTFGILYSGAQTFKKLRLNYRLCDQADFASIDYRIPGDLSCTAMISDPVVEVNGLGWLVSWNLLSGAPGKYFVSTPAVNGGAPQESLVTSFQYLFADLPVGEHIITVRPLCLIGGDWYFGAAKTVSINVTPCQPVDVVEDLYPNAQVGIVYLAYVELNGSQPFTLANIVKPAWMDITLTGSTVELTGTPGEGDVGEDIEVSFDVENCDGANSDHFHTTIDVENP